jgi:hypothetical protein
MVAIDSQFRIVCSPLGPESLREAITAAGRRIPPQ